MFWLQDILGRLPVDIEHLIATLIQIPKVNNVRNTQQRINSIIALKQTLELIPVLITLIGNSQNDYFQTVRNVRVNYELCKNTWLVTHLYFSKCAEIIKLIIFSFSFVGQYNNPRVNINVHCGCIGFERT